MSDTISVSVDTAYDASILVVVRAILDDCDDYPEVNAILNYMPALFIAVEGNAAESWKWANEEGGGDDYKEDTARIVKLLRGALAKFEALQAAIDKDDE